MVPTTLTTVVLKTVTVTGVKLGTPADRIGQGLVVTTANAYPTDNLSPGLFPMPHNPEPESARERQLLSAMHMRKQMQARADGDAVPPASSAGCPSAPGFTAGRFVWSCGDSPSTGWRPTTRTGRASFPGDLRHDDRLGSDCQSPERFSGKRIARWEECPAAAGK
jgi:hypothetical protein